MKSLQLFKAYQLVLCVVAIYNKCFVSQQSLMYLLPGYQEIFLTFSFFF